MKHAMLGLVAAGLLAATACSSSDTPSSTSSSVTAPTIPLVTENFSGTVQVGSYDANPFTVTAAGGLINLTLTAVGPPATIFMGFGVGTYVGTTCQLLTGGYGVVQASATPQLSGTIASGAYCVMVYDAGNQAAPVTYTVTITHY